MSQLNGFNEVEISALSENVVIEEFSDFGAVVEIGNDLVQDTDESNGVDVRGAAVDFDMQPPQVSSSNGYSVVDDRMSCLEPGDPSLSSENVATDGDPASSAVLVTEEVDLSQDQAETNSSDSTLKWLVQPDCSVKNVSMVNGDCGKITSKQGFVPVLSGIVAMYEAPSNFQVSKKVGIDVTQNRLMSNMSPSGKVNLSLKVSKNRMIQIRKPCSVRPKVVVSSPKSLLQKLINHPVERKVTIKMKEGEAGAQALVPSGFNFPSEQQSEPLPAVVNELSSPVSSSALGEMVNNNRPTVNGSKGSQESKIGKGHVRTKLVAVPLVSEDSLSRDATKKSPMVIIMRKRANPTSQNEISKSEVDTQKTKSETANVASHYPRKQSWKPAVKQWFSCTECPARFRFGASLADHAAKHHRVFLCTECEVNFELQSDLGIHLKTHAGRKLHSCSDCDFKSKSEAGLRTHWKVHSKGKLFSCGRCFAEFNKSLSFQAHLLGHKFEKLYKCDNCRANFTSKDGIRGHMVIHANENPFRCTTCPARFKKAASLRNHLKGHHVCSFCPAKFKLKVKLKAHLAMHQ